MRLQPELRPGTRWGTHSTLSNRRKRMKKEGEGTEREKGGLVGLGESYFLALMGMDASRQSCRHR